MKRVLTGLVAVLLLAGCAGQAPQPSATPTPRKVTVRIADVVPLDAYYNLDDKICTAQPIMETKVDHGPQVTISDGSGKVLTSKDGPLQGGTATIEDRCSVDVIFPDVPVSDVYVVTIKNAEGKSWDRTVQASGDEQLIEVQI